MGASRLDRVKVDVAGEIVEITWDEREALLRRIDTVASCQSIVDKFEAVGATRAVELCDANERGHLRLELKLWEKRQAVLPDGLARLLIALVQADPGGQVGAGFLARG